MVQHPLFGEVSKNFNETAALEAYEAFQSDPEYYHALLQMHAHDVVSEVKFTHPEVVDELITKKFEARKAVIKDAVLSGVINKSMTNSTVDEIVFTMDQIQKDISGYTEWERAANTKQQRRDPRGRFIPMGKTKIAQPYAKTDNPYDWGRLAASYDDVTLSRYPDALPPGQKKVPTIKGKIRAHEMNAKHSAAYLQVAEALNKLDPTDMVMADVKWERRDQQGNILDNGKTTMVGSNPADFVRIGDYNNGRYITGIDWYMDMDSARGGGYDLLTGAGMSGTDYLSAAGMADRAGSGPSWADDNKSLGTRTGALYDYNARVGIKSTDMEYGSPGAMGYNRLNATASMIDEIGGDALSGKAKWALGAAKYVGEHGPEAEKVLGPTARRTAYRYRGVERKPDAQLDRSIAASVQGAKSIEDAREMLIHPGMSDNLAGNEKKPESLRIEQDLEFSPFIRYWQSQLPKRENLQLHLNSGAIAPSQGIVFDAKGQVVTQAVGYGDDHYLPFNLKNLSRANRGEWVRTRTMGGPTTEDIYAALTTGTRSVTVVSHSGVYNVEFDDSFRGGRRYNDKAARMVRRYSQLLDTLEAENTTLQDIPSDRKAELEARALQMYRGDSPNAVEERKAYMTRLKNAERQEPKPSQQRVEEWSEEFGNSIADKYSEAYAKNRNFPDVVSWDQLKAQQSVKAGRLLTDIETVEAMGLNKQYNRFLEYKTNEYRAQQQPLKLNGQGYYFALQALQEQFPYYIKRVEWYPPNEPQSGTDKGYVKQNFLRSADIKEGFWDPEIEGFHGSEENIKGNKKVTGKVQGNHTNYQNMANRMSVEDIPEKDRQGAKTGATTGLPGSTTNPNQAPPAGGGATTPSAIGGGGGRSLLVSGLPGTGVRMTRKAEAQLTPEAVAGMVELGDAMTSVTMGNPATGVPVSLGRANVNWLPYLSNWETTKQAIEYGDEVTMTNLGRELDAIFVTWPTDTQDGPGILSKTVRTTHGQSYKAKVESKMMKAPKTAVDAVAEKNNDQRWVLGPKFIPGRTSDEYISAQRDDDVRNFRDRAPIFKTEAIFRNQVNGADAAIRHFPDAGYIYGNETYYKGDAETLAKRVENDVYGYLKVKALAREEGTIPGPFEGQGEGIPDTPEEAEKISQAKVKEKFMTTGMRREKGMEEYDRKKRDEEANRALVTPIPSGGLVPFDLSGLPSSGGSFNDIDRIEEYANTHRSDGKTVKLNKINPMSQPPGW